MTTTDYKGLADMLGRLEPSALSSPARKEQWRRTVEAVIELCENGNPRFKTDLFLDAIQRYKDNQLGKQ